VGDNSLTGIDIAPDSLNGADIGPLTGGDVADDSLTGDDISESSLLGLDATTLAGREVCSFNQRVTGNNSTQTDVNADVCTIGPLEVTVKCESQAGGDSLSAQVLVDTSVDDTAVAGDFPVADFDAGDGVSDVQRLNDTTENDTATIESIPFSVWIPGIVHLAGNSAIRANSLTNNTRTCDFAIFATG
jgi:hypothetical protein